MRAGARGSDVADVPAYAKREATPGREYSFELGGMDGAGGPDGDNSAGVWYSPGTDSCTDGDGGGAEERWTEADRGSRAEPNARGAAGGRGGAVNDSADWSGVDDSHHVCVAACATGLQDGPSVADQFDHSKRFVQGPQCGNSGLAAAAGQDSRDARSADGSTLDSATDPTPSGTDDGGVCDGVDARRRKCYSAGSNAWADGRAGSTHAQRVAFLRKQTRRPASR